MESHKSRTGSQKSKGEPTSFQLALALAVCRSKLPNFSIKDHIKTLRCTIISEQQVQTGASYHRFNPVAYYKCLYEQAESRTSELQAAVLMLTQRNQALEAQLPDKDADKSPRGHKRKRGKSQAPELKRARKGKQSDEVHFDVGMNLYKMVDKYQEEKSIGLQAKQGISSCLYHLSNLDRMPTPDPSELAHLLDQTCIGLVSCIRDACKDLIKPPAGIPCASPSQRSSELSRSEVLSKTENELKYVLYACHRSFTMLLHFLSELDNPQDASTKQARGFATYGLTMLFPQIFECMSDPSNGISTVEAHLSSEKDQTARIAGKLQPKQRSPRINIPESLAGFLVSCLTALNATSSTHRDVFEGFVFILFQTIGKRLYSAVFSRERSSNIEGEIQTQEEMDTPNKDLNDTVNEKIKSPEAPHLIAILEVVMSLAPAFLSPSVQRTKPVTKSAKGARKSTSTAKGSGNVAKCGVSLLLRDRLQRTLVKAVFGDDKRDYFTDFLRMPARPQLVPHVIKPVTANTHEWFTAELWRLLGWEILEREGDL